jgi:hypothetical protein
MPKLFFGPATPFQLKSFIKPMVGVKRTSNPPPNRNAEGKSTEVNASVELHSKWSVNLYSTKTERPSFSWWDEKASAHNRYIARLDGNHVSRAWSNYDAGQRGNARGACYDFKYWR